MKNETFNKVKEIIKEVENDYNENLNDSLFYWIDENDLKECCDVYDIIQYLESLNSDRQITDNDIIYYSNAIEYLKENDSSLNESMRIATDLGYTTENINSELLASLLLCENNLEEFNDLLKEIENRLDSEDLDFEDEEEEENDNEEKKEN